MKHMTTKKVIAGLLLLTLTASAGCSSIDSKDDVLSPYTVDSVLSVPTQTPAVTLAPSPTPTPNGTIQPITQDWQNDDSNPGGDDPVDPNTTPMTFVRLEQGNSGEEVTKLQNRLIELGYMTGNADGNFGNATKTAIKSFQRALGLSQSGVASVSLQEKLFRSNAPKYDPEGGTPTPVYTKEPVQAVTPAPNNNGNDNNDNADNQKRYTYLKKGSSGTAVTNLQRRLIELGYLDSTADGKYGSATANAVKKFQKAMGYDQNGAASGYLQEKLYARNAPSAPSAPKATAAPTSAAYVQLEPGDTGARVKKLQQRLKELGYYSGTIDGNYYRDTTTAVKAFQNALGLNETGISTVALQTKLFSSSAPSAEATAAPAKTSSYSDLSSGSSGTAVKRLQQRLIELGYLKGAADGKYGTGTSNAVKRFQNTLGLKTTGVATAALQKKLYANDAPVYTPASTPTPSPTYKYVEMKKGDKGNRVKTLQKRLQELGYFDGEIGGNYLTKTEDAVKKFQAAIGYKQTGVATIETQQVLFSNEAPSYSGGSSSPTTAPTQGTQYVEMNSGDTGNRVKALQRRLKELGYFDGEIGGNYLSKTTAAVKRFQAAVGLEEDGVATIEMQEILFSDDAPAYSGGGSSSGSQYVALNPGDTGNRVKKLQARLIELGYMDGSADGEYGGITIAAIKLFQNLTGMNVDGKASVAFQEALFASNAPSYSNGDSGDNPVVYTDLEYGSTGEEVKNLQKRLQMLGYFTFDNGEVEGEYLEDTAEAVRQFQLAIGYSDDDATGIASSDLQVILFSDDALLYKKD